MELYQIVLLLCCLSLTHTHAHTPPLSLSLSASTPVLEVGVRADSSPPPQLNHTAKQLCNSDVFFPPVVSHLTVNNGKKNISYFLSSLSIYCIALTLFQSFPLLCLAQEDKVTEAAWTIRLLCSEGSELMLSQASSQSREPGSKWAVMAFLTL